MLLSLFVIARQEDGRAYEDRLSPELREEGALEPEALDVLGVRRNLHRRDLFAKRQSHGSPAARVQMHFPDLAVEVAGRDLKDLTLPLVRVELDGMPVRPVERRVDVEQPLDEVVAGADVRQPGDRITESRGADGGPPGRLPSLDVRPEERRRTVLLSVLAELEARLGLPFLRDHHEDATVGGLAPDARRKRQLEFQRRVRPVALLGSTNRQWSGQSQQDRDPSPDQETTPFLSS